MTADDRSPGGSRGGRRSWWVESLAVVAALAIVIGAAVALSRPRLTLPVVAQPAASVAPDNPDEFTRWFTATRGVEGTGISADIYIQGADVLRDSIRRQDRLVEQGNERAQVLARVGAVGNEWTWLGPSNQGGRTRAFVDLVDPPDSTEDTMLAAGVTGGIWRSVNGGTTWQPLTDTHSNIAVGVLEVSPHDGTLIYAGTGEAYFARRHENRGAGIMVSQDAGQTWEFLPSTRENANFWWVGDVEVSPNDPDTLYAATSTGVWVSTDGGESWGEGPVLPASQEPGCQELAIRPDRSPDLVIASCGHEEGPDGVYYSADAANRIPNWEPISFPGVPTHGYVALAMAPSDPDVVYASVSGVDSLAAGLFRSNDGGAPNSWTLTTRPEADSPELRPDWLAYCEREYRGGGQGGYNNAIAVDPSDPDRLWLGGIDLYRSEDGGATLQRASWWNPSLAGAAYVHADQHTIVFNADYGDADRTVYFANDGGLFKIEDDRVDLASTDTRPEAALGARECRPLPAAVRFEEINDYGVTQFISGSVSADGDTVLGGTQDNGSYMLTGDAGTDAWVQVLSGDGGFSVIDSVSRTYVVSYVRFAFYRASIDDPFRWSYADGRLSEAYVDRVPLPGKNACGILGCSLFYPPLEIDPNDGQVLWTGGNQIWRSADQGSTWSAASGLLPDPMEIGNFISAIAIANGDSDLIYVGTNRGNLWRTTTGGSSWELADPFGSLPGGATVSSITFDPVDTGTVYVGFKTFDPNTHQIWKTTGEGAWQSVDISITDDDGDEVAMDYPVNTIAVNPLNNQMVYAGTDMGVFESLDGGESWRVANGNLATTIVNRLVFRTGAEAGTSDLYAFTFGRGAYRVDVGDAAELLTLPPPP